MPNPTLPMATKVKLPPLPATPLPTIPTSVPTIPFLSPLHQNELPALEIPRLWVFISSLECFLEKFYIGYFGTCYVNCGFWSYELWVSHSHPDNNLVSMPF
ncbi:hypothetical protein ACOSQ3_023989 [Xanthoceras sorbifolium]